MSTVNGLLILLLFQCAGEMVKAYFNLRLPGPVLGMFLLFFGLCLYRGIPVVVGRASQQLIPLLTLMFLPAATGIFFLGSQYREQWPAILIAIVLGSMLSLFFNGLVMKVLSRPKLEKI